MTEPHASTHAPSQRLTDPLATSEHRTYSVLMHLTLLLHATAVGLPLAPVVVLVMWLVKKDESEFIADHGREALNFQLSLIIYALVFTALGFVTCGVTWVLGLGVYVLGIVGMILAAIAANRGEYFRYPMTLRLVG
jgi:uncharacterized Tic20 family protein